LQLATVVVAERAGVVGAAAGKRQKVAVFFAGGPDYLRSGKLRHIGSNAPFNRNDKQVIFYIINYGVGYKRSI
ncbi:MAG: hypothetical protein ACYS6K_28525, partial [Planctomycetota bacterium]|jgi:hypothetical protein